MNGGTQSDRALPVVTTPTSVAAGVPAWARGTASLAPSSSFRSIRTVDTRTSDHGAHALMYMRSTTAPAPRIPQMHEPAADVARTDEASACGVNRGRFVGAVPRQLHCGLCGQVPTEALQAPCKHLMCARGVESRVDASGHITCGLCGVSYGCERLLQPTPTVEHLLSRLVIR